MALLLSMVPLRAMAAEAPREPPRQEGAREDEQKRHVLGLRVDTGARGTDYGLGYLHVHESTQSKGGLGMTMWLGYGADVRLLTMSHDRVDGILTYATGRLSTMGDAGGIAFEAALGAGTAHGETRPSAALGVFWSALFVDLGYSYQFPIDGGGRPGWLSSHQFSVRVHVPVRSYDARTTFPTERQ
ncbi:hypothetical protein LVJ94_51755 [Pendulispora rubella]|uniref:Uncharacterized protein n=1 Tax=Pendulispora rubella TaxID=2741070 RepID=A0ABZ2L345_9BACT